jgi:phospholipase C
MYTVNRTKALTLVAARVALMLLLISASFHSAQGQITSFQHIVLIVQENRTPDDLFQGLCIPPYGNAGDCGTGADQYDIQSYGFYGNGKQIALAPVPLGNAYDPVHAHSGFEDMCNPDPTTRYPCTQNTRLATDGCPTKCSFEYVDPTTTPTIYPYLYLAQNFGWANLMFQTNQGPSAPAHQFLFGGTSAPSAADDAAATFISENPSGLGCLAPLNSVYHAIDPAHAPFEFDLTNNPRGTVCFSRETLSTLIENAQHTWRYYTVGTVKTGVSDYIWTAPNWIQEICQPDSTFTKCTGTDWIDNVDLNPTDVLTDLQNCNLKNMVWVIPTGVNSDHPDGGLDGPNDGGPAWVANVINGVANSTCKDTINGTAVPYWEDTAIIVTWDDWGGFYDHVLPPFLSDPSEGQGDYQLGFRVPLLFVSAYTHHTIDSTNQYDFGSILRFAESNFGIAEGALGFADARSETDLTGFYSFKRAPIKFQVPTSVPADFFLHDKRPLTAPDND